MDISKLLHLQNRIVPEMLEKLNKRYELLSSIKLRQPIGRKSLCEEIGLSERKLRTECEILSNLGLISKNSAGMSITFEGEGVLKELGQIFVEDPFLHIRKKIKEYFGIKDIYVVKGDFNKSEITRKLMVRLLLDKVNNLLTKECVIGVSGGTTMHYLAKNVDKTFGYGKDVMITPIRGGFSASKNSWQSNYIATRFGINSNHKYQLLHAPDNLKETTLDELKKEPIMKQSLSIINKSSIIIHSIGGAFEMAERRKLPAETMKILKEKKAISETFGSFYNKEGKIVYSICTVGMDIEDVQKVADIFTIVGGAEKGDAVLSYLNSKPKNATFIIDEAICKKILTKI